MSRIDPPSDAEMGSRERELLEQVREVHGFVPNQHALDAHFPLLLRSLLDLNRRVMLAGDLDSLFLEKLALILSVENECPYCVNFHEMVLEGRESEAEIRALEGNWRAADLSPLEQEMAELALAANDDPHAVSDADIAALLEAGATERDLVQLMHFVFLIRGYNTFNVVFDTDLDERSGGWMD